ncbi:MAG: hypothetical protein FWF02_02380, partial [Micrococcales bacterium]|nr:hypothetical protein [Micrococcales bacterium]
PAAGAYFRIQDLGPGTTPGTTVRLRLRAGVDQSCVDELRSVVVVAPYELTADDHVHQVQHRWAPGVLDTTSTALRTSHETPRVAAPGSDGTTRVWFVSHYEDGGVLADGLWAGQAKDCVVVNLEAEHAPLLTVDRTEMISHDAAAVSALLLDAVPALVNSGDNLLRPYWLLQLANTEPEVADALYQARSAAGPWPYQPEVAQHWTGTVDLARTGVAADDDNAFADVTRTGVRQPKTAVEGWHLSALLAAGAVPHLGIDVTHWRVQPALPSDSVLLTSHLDVDLGPACGDYRGYLAGPPSAPHIACATVQMRRPATQVVSRLRQLGYDVADTPEPDELDARLLDVLRHHSLEDTPARSLDENTPVGSLDVALLAARLQVSPQLVVQRAGRLGLVVPDPSSLVPVDAFGRLIASMGRDSQPPWLPPDRLVSVDQMVAAADASQRPLADVAAELTRLGYDVPSLPEDIDTARADAKIFLLHDWRDRARPIDAQAIASHVNLPVADVEARVHAYGFTLTARTPAGEDRLLQARDLDSRAPWLTPRQAITPRFLADAARRVGRPVDDLRAYYLAAGFTVTDDTDDDVLLSRGLNRTRPYLDHTTPVPLTHVCAAAIRLRWPLAATAERLHQLGYHCAPASSTPSPQPGEWGFAQRHHEPWPVGVICGPRVIKTARGRALGIADQAAELGWPLVGAVPELSDKLERRLASAYDIRQALGRVTILSLASCFTMTSETVVRRLAQLGFVVVPGEAPLPRRVDKPLRVLLGDQLQLPPPEHDERLPARFVLAGALKLGIELREATRILTEAGVRFTDPLDILPVERPGDAPRWDEW